MILPLEINFQGIGHSEAVEAKIRERAEKLGQFAPRLARCEVWVNAPHRHHKKGPFYDVRVRMTVPGEELVVDHQPDRDRRLRRDPRDLRRRAAAAGRL